MINKTTYLKLTKLSDAFVDVIQHAQATCQENRYPEAAGVKTTRTTAIATLDFWERVAEDCERIAEEYDCGDRSVGHATFSDCSDEFIAAADARLVATWTKRAKTIQKQVDRALSHGGRFIDGSTEDLR